MSVQDGNGLTELQQTVQIRIGAEPIPGWIIVRYLGGGGFGSAWCIERSTGNAKLTEALKVIRIQQNERFEQMLQRELDAMLILRDHPNIVRCDDFFYAKADTGTWIDQALMIRMELLTPLDKHFESNPPDENEVIRMGTDILTALDQLYKQKMIHRDIKPANIFLNNYGVYKLGDYGLARTIDSEDPSLSKGCGTLPFMAPEMLKGEEYDHTVDMYALALTMYLYLNGGTLLDLPPWIGRITNPKIPDPKYASPWLNRILQKALAFNPKDRFANPGEFLNALKGAENAATEANPVSAVPNVSEQPDRVTKLLQTEKAVANHRANLEKSIHDSISSRDAFMNEHLSRNS